MWCHVSSKSLATLPAAVWRCGRILVALSVGLLMLGFYWDAAREAQVPEQQNYPGQEDVLDQENNGESRGSTPLSAGSQNDDALGSYAFMEGKFKGGEDVPNNVLKDYSGTKSEEDLELYLEEEILKMDLDSLITSKTSPPTTTTTTTSAPPPATTTTSPTNHKTILFYSKFFSNPWSGFLSRRTSLMHKCPVSTCVFLENSSHPEDADAVIFHALDFRPESVPARRRPDQLYVWLTLEAPAWDEYGHGLQRLKPNYKILQTVEKRFGRPGLFNWTSTYHRESDVMLPYGGFLPLEGEGDYVRPGLLDKSGVAYREFSAALDRGDILQEDEGRDWAAFLSRPKLVAWMVSHCSTSSGREFYVRELRQHIQVDVYGSCGELKCSKEQMRKCYKKVLRPTYKFYLAFENNLCEDYVTEKVWKPLHYGLVPVVYGGARYSDILPPHSYVDATHLTPLQLAKLLSSIASSPQLYGRYHLWRKYWKVLIKPPLCELCLKLHSQAHGSSEGALRRQYYHNLRGWWWSVSNCTTHYPQHRYPRPP